MIYVTPFLCRVIFFIVCYLYRLTFWLHHENKTLENLMVFVKPFVQITNHTTIYIVKALTCKLITSYTRLCVIQEMIQMFLTRHDTHSLPPISQLDWRKSPEKVECKHILEIIGFYDTFPSFIVTHKHKTNNLPGTLIDTIKVIWIPTKINK